jgi:hypothetical protein
VEGGDCFGHAARMDAFEFLPIGFPPDCSRIVGYGHGQYGSD